MKHIEPQYLYKKIDSAQLNSSGCLPFSKDEIDRVFKCMGPKIEYDNTSRMIRLGRVSTRSAHGWGHIFKRPDEWFYVFSIQGSNFTSCYECDQMDGLIDCLERIYKSRPGNGRWNRRGWNITIS